MSNPVICDAQIQTGIDWYTNDSNIRLQKKNLRYKNEKKQRDQVQELKPQQYQMQTWVCQKAAKLCHGMLESLYFILILFSFYQFSLI